MLQFPQVSCDSMHVARRLFLALIEIALIMQRHPFFRGIEWETLRQQRAPFEPVVMHELDTRNFDHFDEEISPSSTSARRRYGRVDRDFIGYTYKEL